jgi:hypothetical protein
VRGWRRSGTVALATAGALVFSTGVALGYYNAGVDAAPVTATTAGGTVELHATAVPAAPLLPGGPAVDLRVTVRNPLDAPVRVTGIAGTATGCTTPDLQVGRPAELPLDVGPRAEVTTTLTGVARLGLGSSDDCQGRALTVRYVVTAEV